MAAMASVESGRRDEDALMAGDIARSPEKDFGFRRVRVVTTRAGTEVRHGRRRDEGEVAGFESGRGTLYLFGSPHHTTSHRTWPCTCPSPPI